MKSFIPPYQCSAKRIVTFKKNIQYCKNYISLDRCAMTNQVLEEFLGSCHSLTKLTLNGIDVSDVNLKKFVLQNRKKYRLTLVLTNYCNLSCSMIFHNFFYNQ